MDLDKAINDPRNLSRVLVVDRSGNIIGVRRIELPQVAKTFAAKGMRLATAADLKKK